MPQKGRRFGDYFKITDTKQQPGLNQAQKGRKIVKDTPPSPQRKTIGVSPRISLKKAKPKKARADWFIKLVKLSTVIPPYSEKSHSTSNSSPSYSANQDQSSGNSIDSTTVDSPMAELLKTSSISAAADTYDSEGYFWGDEDTLHEADLGEEFFARKESLAGKLYRYLLGANHAPKTRWLDESDSNESLNNYVISKAIPNFNSWAESEPWKSYELLKCLGIGEVATAAWFLGEIDLNAGNIGEAPAAGSVLPRLFKIDHGMSLCELNTPLTIDGLQCLHKPDPIFASSFRADTWIFAELGLKYPQDLIQLEQLKTLSKIAAMDLNFLERLIRFEMLEGVAATDLATYHQYHPTVERMIIDQKARVMQCRDIAFEVFSNPAKHYPNLDLKSLTPPTGTTDPQAFYNLSQQIEPLIQAEAQKLAGVDKPVAPEVKADPATPLQQAAAFHPNFSLTVVKKAATVDKEPPAAKPVHTEEEIKRLLVRL